MEILQMVSEIDMKYLTLCMDHEVRKSTIDNGSIFVD